MRRLPSTGWTKRRLALALGGFLLLIALPSALLIRLALSQIRWASFHSYQTLAIEVGRQINERLAGIIAQENDRAFSDYQFLVVGAGGDANALRRSPLSRLEQSHLPGLIGYFQIDPRGRMSTPLLPAAGNEVEAGELTQSQRRERAAIRDQLYAVLARNRLVPAVGSMGGRFAAPRAAELRHDGYAKDKSSVLSSRSYADRKTDAVLSDHVANAPSQAPEVEAQSNFDALSGERRKVRQGDDRAAGLGRLEQLNLGQTYQRQASPAPSAPTESPARRTDKRILRKEQMALPANDQTDVVGEPLRVLTFESEVDPFKLSLLGSGHLVLYRNAWRDGQRYIQGALLDQSTFLTALFGRVFRDSALPRVSDLVVAYGGEILRIVKGAGGTAGGRGLSELGGQLLYQLRPAAPWSDFELIFTIEHVPLGSAGLVMYWTAAVLGLALSAGCLGLYRIGLRQMRLIRQQQDFVSAVSHELKTPLTSIRLYSELLREGWTSEEKKATYYDFIYQESERLSRLIANVLQLARLTRSELKVEIHKIDLGQLLDSTRSKLDTQVERAGFRLHLDCPKEMARRSIEIDPDAFAQILINLIDNALKFAVQAERKEIDVSCRQAGAQRVVVAVRDYGPGIPRKQLKKIFELFYRVEGELTRETAGTGIGLALVQRLAQAMNGRVEVANRSPGVEFQVVFPLDG